MCYDKIDFGNLSQLPNLRSFNFFFPHFLGLKTEKCKQIRQ